jgi:type I restriction enzyme S subunit
MTQNNKLPKDWRIVKLKDIATLSSQKHSPVKPEDLFYIGLEHIEKHTGKLTSKVGLDKITTIKNKFSKGDILYGKLRPNLNKVYLSKEEGVCSTDILVLKLSEECLGKYLHAIMFSTTFVNKMSDNTSGVNLPRVSTKFIMNYEIPLPPLEAQSLIVSKIDELFSELDKGIEDLKTAQQQLKTYRQSVLKWAFEGRLTNEKVKDGVLPKGWRLENLNKVSKIVSGFAFKSSDFISTGIPVIKISNVGYSEFVWKDQKYLSKDFLVSNSDFILKGGNLLIALTRPITNNTTKICRFPQNIGEGLLNQRVACIKEFKINENFLFLYFQTNIFKEYIRSKFSETLQPNLSPKDLALTSIPVCSNEEQHQIVQEIESRLSVADKMEESIVQSLQQAEALRQSILKKAFSGELV